MHQALALWSINERLAGRAGVDMVRPSDEWLEDLMDVMIKRAEENEENKNRSNDGWPL